MTNENARPKRVETILIVDDEEMVTRSIARLLEMETDYRPLTFQSPQKALRAMRTEPIDCVVSDFLMPDMDGIALLKQVKQIAPEVPGIILTGYADKESAIKAINDVNLFQYLEKPWDNDNLKLVIRNAVNQRSTRQILLQRLHELDRATTDRDNFRHTAESFQAELKLAEEVQQSILPRGPLLDEFFKFFYRYFPTGRLGGDFFDIAFTGPGRFNAIVADVAGHGVAAALGTMLVKVVFRDASARGVCCDQMLMDMNIRLGEYLSSRQFVTAFIMTFDGPNNQVTAASAGGPPPIIFGREGDHPAEQWVLTGFPLGIFDAQTFQKPDCQTRRFGPGERILLYTDGLLDIDIEHSEPTPPEEFVKEIEDMRHFGGDDLLDRVAVSRDMGKKPLPDDINLLLIEYL